MVQNSSTARKAVKPAAAPAPVGRRERNKAEKQARIVAAARHLFHTQGFAETTTLQIAETADIGTGTLFLYARSKEALLVLVFKDEMMEVALDSFTKSPPRARSPSRRSRCSNGWSTTMRVTSTSAAT